MGKGINREELKLHINPTTLACPLFYLQCVGQLSTDKVNNTGRNRSPRIRALEPQRALASFGGLHTHGSLCSISRISVLKGLESKPTVCNSNNFPGDSGVIFLGTIFEELVPLNIRRKWKRCSHAGMLPCLLSKIKVNKEEGPNVQLTKEFFVL